MTRGWYRIGHKANRKAHWVFWADGGQGQTMCELTGQVVDAGRAPHCQTCVKRLG